MKKLLGILLILTACCSQQEQDALRDAQAHAEKIRNHFLGYVSEDVSTLITETQIMSYRLKSLKFCKLANKFNSYSRRHANAYGVHTYGPSDHAGIPHR